jgi:hypothetical protein
MLGALRAQALMQKEHLFRQPLKNCGPFVHLGGGPRCKSCSCGCYCCVDVRGVSSWHTADQLLCCRIDAWQALPRLSRPPFTCTQIMIGITMSQTATSSIESCRFENKPTHSLVLFCFSLFCFLFCLFVRSCVHVRSGIRTSPT